MLLSLMLYISMTPIVVGGAISCPPRNALIDPDRDLVQKVAIYDDVKPRDKTAFAQIKGVTEAAIDLQYGATGVFACEDAAGNGQAVVSRNKIVTVLHTFLRDRNSCNKPRDIKSCAFYYKENGRDIKIPMKRVIAKGECKPGEIIETGNDWVIVELEKPLPKTINPYLAPKQAALAPGLAVTMVGRTSALNSDAGKKGFLDYPQSFSSCVALHRDTFKYWREYQSNCPGAEGGSGSGVLIGEGTPTLAGLLSSDMPTKSICIPQVNPTSDDGPFEKNCRGSLIVPAEGKFLEALQAIK